MRKSVQRNFLLFIAAILFCADISAAELKIIAITDTHGAWRSMPEHNWLQMAYGISESESKDDIPVLKIDCGDTLSGSREAAESGYMLGIHALNYLDFDVWIPGNHDFDNGTEHLTAMIELFNGKVICCNIDHPEILPYFIFERGGFRIAVVGLLTPTTRNFFVGDTFLPEITGEKESVDNTFKILRASGEDFDFAILAMHRGIYTKGDSIYEILMSNPEIKLVLGGHSHIISIAEPLRQAVFSAAGRNCEGFMEIIVSAQEEQKNDPEMLFFFRESAAYPADETFAAAVESNWDIVTAEELDRVIGRFSPAPASDIKSKRTSTLAAMYLQAMLADTPVGTTAITVVPTGRRKSFPAEVTLRTIFEMAPHKDRVLLFTVTREELAIIAEEHLARSAKEATTPVFANLRITCNKEGTVVAIEPVQEFYTVAFTDFIAAGSGGKMPQTAEILRDRQFIDCGLLRTKLELLAASAEIINLVPPEWFILQE